MKTQYAFPIENTSPEYAGMTLRDWFAGQALVGVVARMTHESLYPNDAAADGLRYADGTLHGQAQAIAEDAYALADAMLAVRKTADGRFPQSSRAAEVPQ